VLNLNHLKARRERVRKDSRRVEAKINYGGEVRDTLFLGGERLSYS
jgi:hypothetical protein